MPQGAKRALAPSTGDTYRLELSARIHRAFKQFNATKPRAEELSQAKLGELVSRRLRQKEAITQATVSRWMSDANPITPDNPTLAAIADVLNCDKTWLAFGGTLD